MLKGKWVMKFSEIHDVFMNIIIYFHLKDIVENRFILVDNLNKLLFEHGNMW